MPEDYKIVRHNILCDCGVMIVYLAEISGLSSLKRSLLTKRMRKHAKRTENVQKGIRGYYFFDHEIKTCPRCSAPLTSEKVSAVQYSDGDDLLKGLAWPE